MNKLIDEYVNWLKEKISYKKINEWFEVNTPFINHFNDFIQIFVKIDENKIILTDDGETLKNLEMSGVEIDTPKRKREIEIVLNGYGIKLEKRNLCVYANRENFPLKKHNLIQAIISIDDLFVLAQPKITSFFLEDVENYLKINEVRYSKNITLEGKSGYQNKFDFLIPASRKALERIIKVANEPIKSNIISIIFSFNDTRQERENDGIVILNDAKKEIPHEISQALKEYNIFEIPWSKREELKAKLVA